MTAISDYKMKVWNPSAQSSRKTCLGPTYGGEVNRMKKLVVPSQEEAYLIYSTATKVIGLIKMPLDGTVPLDELPNLMRAMGYYPTEHEVKQMKDEVMFSEYSEDGI